MLTGPPAAIISGDAVSSGTRQFRGADAISIRGGDDRYNLVQDYAERRGLRSELRALQKEECKRQERAVTEVVRSAQVPRSLNPATDLSAAAAVSASQSDRLTA